ncbi:MAG: DNA-binding transcriptional regulator, LacI/PurR family [Friedmanniella sp.]|nr:DNA-binding transcriptional regulator, LacI/PurR family [Friedmanniella sp.]
MTRGEGDRDGAAAPEPTGPDRRRNRRPTAADVARHAGLSRATVSYVLNNTPHQVIPEPTRQRVQKAAAELGYVPSAAARALSSGRSDVVLLLLPDWPIGPSVGALLEHLSTALADQGFTFVAHPRSAGRPVSEVWKALTPAAVITFEELDDIESARLRTAGVELAVALFGGSRGGRAMDLPEQRTGRLQAEHLAAVGHRHLGYAWPADPRVLAFAQPRLEGVRQACAELGLPEPVVHPVALGPDGATAAVADWLAAEPAVTGVCAYNDEVALTVMAGVRRQGRQVPGDLAVIGVDNIAAGAVSWPTLTTVEVDQASVARYIAGAISSKIAGEPLPGRPASDIHTVILRESA